MQQIVRAASSMTKITPAARELVRIVGNNRRMQEVFKLIGRVVSGTSPC